MINGMDLDYVYIQFKMSLNEGNSENRSGFFGE